MELEDKDKRTFEDFLTFLQFHPDLKMWEIDPEPILSLPGLQIYPDRRKIYHGQQEIELNTKEFALLCLLVTNKGRVLTYGQMYEKVWKEEPLAMKISRWAAMCGVCGRNCTQPFPGHLLQFPVSGTSGTAWKYIDD